MKIWEVLKWNNRISALYALGVWTMIGSYGYLKYTGRLGDSPGEDSPEQTELEEEQEDPNKTIHQGDYMKTIVTRKENFVPYTTRIYTNFTSFMGETKSEK